MKEYRCAANTLTGRRTRNQDNFLMNGKILDAKHGDDKLTISGTLKDALFLAVVDGAGTKQTGENASRLICEQLWNIREKFEEMNDLSDASSIINSALVESNKIIESVMEDEPTSKMGATAAVLLIYNEKAILGNVGDSAVYLRRDGKVKKLTTDHTEGEELLARGALTEDMLKINQAKTKVTRRIGYMSFGQTDIMQFYSIEDVRVGDIFILASPGVVQYIYPDDINDAVQSGVDVVKCAERIIKSSMDHESKDNATAMVLKISEPVDNIGNKKARIKPIKATNVRVRTSLDLDPAIIKKVLYTLAVIFILGFSFFYIYKNYPRPQKLTHTYQKDYSWIDQKND